MQHADKSHNRPHDYSPALNNIGHFITRKRLDDSELDEWLLTAFGSKPDFDSMPREELLTALKDALDGRTKEIFGEHMPLNSLGGIVLLTTQMLANVEEAQGRHMDKANQIPPLSRAYELVRALDDASKGDRLRRRQLEALRHGGEILEDLSNYIRELVLVLPWSIKDEDVRERIQATTRGMPGVDLKVSFMSREYNEHIKPFIPSISFSGRIR